MTLHCRKAQQALKAFYADKLDADACAAVEMHLSHCAQCRSAARGQGLAGLLKAAAQAPIPKPSDFFITRLSAALAKCPAPRPSVTMAELLSHSSLRLAPALAALVMLISVGSGYLTASNDDAAATVPAEELLLEDHPLTADLMLAAITGETIER
jgi:Putative zinc-finger